ncbi:hypothetical protein ACWD3J_13845 [Streptomyces sp. NPDC002755]
MADGDVVKMRLTFWRDQQPPGTVIDVPADEVHRWKGFAVVADEPEQQSGETTTPTAATSEQPKPASAKANSGSKA